MQRSEKGAGIKRRQIDKWVEETGRWQRDSLSTNKHTHKLSSVSLVQLWMAPGNARVFRAALQLISKFKYLVLSTLITKQPNDSLTETHSDKSTGFVPENQWRENQSWQSFINHSVLALAHSSASAKSLLAGHLQPVTPTPHPSPSQISYQRTRETLPTRMLLLSLRPNEKQINCAQFKKCLPNPETHSVTAMAQMMRTSKQVSVFLLL